MPEETAQEETAQAKMKPAFLIILAKIHDREAFLSGYAVEAAELTARFGGKYLLRAPGAASMEGSLGDGYSVVISQWPDRATAEKFWRSPEYEAVAKLREGICDVEVQLVEGELDLGGLELGGLESGGVVS